MIPFQFHTFWRLLRTPGPMQAASLRGRLHRWRFFLLFPLFQIVNAGMLSVDYLLFHFRDQVVSKPLFIISSPRSGSTVLHRALLKDQDRFTSLALWQSIFPSLATQVPVRWLGALDQKLGGHLARMVEKLQDRAFRNSDRYHRIRLEEVEEDEVLFLHACASELLGNAFPIPEIWKEYRHFDKMPDAQRLPLMNHYLACVQRHMLLQGRGRRFVSKNPPFCHKVHSLRQTFPDAGFIMLVRHPAESVCSLLSMLDSFRSSVGLRAKDWVHPRRDPGALDFSVDCYRHALAALDQLPPENVLIVRYEELVRSPKVIIQQIYEKFGMEVGTAYAAELEQMQQAAEGYRSRHHYSPEQFGLTAAEIRAMIPEIYERFGYGVEPG